MVLHSYLVFICLTDKLNENRPQLWRKAWQKSLLQWFEIQRSSWHSSAPNVRPHSAAMHAAGTSRYLVPGLPASEVATRVNRNLKNVFMEIVDVSRLQRAEHIDNCKKRPRSAWNIVCPCGFFAFFLKEKWLGEDETAFLLKWQMLCSRSKCLCLCCCTSSSLVSADWRLPQPQEHKPASETQPEELQPGHLLSLWLCVMNPLHIWEEQLALMVSYLPSPKQMAAGDRKGISTCQTPSSEYPAGTLFPENKHIFIILVWLQRKTYLDGLFC